MKSTVLKLIFGLLVLFVAYERLPEIHKATRLMFEKRAKKGFSSLEEFNSKLWHKSEEK
jgi:hypothetical protein